MRERATFDLFELLLTVSGVGVKGALAIVSKISPAEFARAVATQDLKTLTRLPGVGKKSAERILLELKDKIQPLADNSTLQAAQVSSKAQDEAAEALEALGYTASEIAQAFKAAPPNSSTEQLIKFALKELNRLGGNNMLVFRWYALLPERDMDWVRKTCAHIFSDYFGTLWREDTLKYDVRADNWTKLPQDDMVYNPIISATFSFIAVCNVDMDTVKQLARRIDTQLHCYLPALYKSFILDGKILVFNELLEEDEPTD